MRLLWATIAVALATIACGSGATNELRVSPRSITVENDIVEVSGSWYEETNRLPSTIARINAVRLVCRKSEMTCQESIAMVSRPDDRLAVKDRLMSFVFSYKVTSWTDAALEATSETRVSDLTLKLDLAGQAASRTSQETEARGARISDPVHRDWVLR